MDFHFLVMEKSWKINVEQERAPCYWENNTFNQETLQAPYKLGVLQLLQLSALAAVTESSLM